MLHSDSRPNRRQALTSLAALAAAPLVLGPWHHPHGPPHRSSEHGSRSSGVSSSAPSSSPLSRIPRAFIDGPYPIIGKNSTEDEVRQLMRGNLVQEQRCQPGFSPTVLNTGKELVLFDTENGATGFVPRPNGGWLVDQLGPAGFKAEDIDVVVLTQATRTISRASSRAASRYSPMLAT